jgi:hypothetical protein
LYSKVNDDNIFHNLIEIGGESGQSVVNYT